MNPAETPAPASDYRVSRAVAVRLGGVAVLVLGGLLLLLALVLAAADAPGWSLLVLLVGVALAVTAVSVAVVRRPRVLHLDEEGYRVRLVRGVGVPAARWSEVDDVVAATVMGARCLVLRLDDGRTSTVPVGFLDADVTALVEQLRGRLERGHGYRAPGGGGSPQEPSGR